MLKNNAQAPAASHGGNLCNDIGGPSQKCCQYDELYRLISPNASFGSTVTSCFDAIANDHSFS